MVTDGTSFLRRAQLFFRELQAGRYPNSNSLAELCRCSKNTAQRTIYRLRDEYLVPIEYESSERGYYLTDPNFTLPSLLPAGKDELTALLLARDLVSSLDASDLITHLDTLWHKFANANSSLNRELAPLASIFSSDSTVVGDLADCGILQYVSAAVRGESIELRYKSPWRHSEAKTYQGKIERVHFSDGSLYLLFCDTDGHERILNCSFVKEFKILNTDLNINPTPNSPDRITSQNWLHGFGIWAGSEPETIEIRILPPAAEYFASQRWHEDQEDTWDGEVLVRTISAIISPELERRILSLGRHVQALKPESLRKQVLEQALSLSQNLRVSV